MHKTLLAFFAAVLLASAPVRAMDGMVTMDHNLGSAYMEPHEWWGERQDAAFLSGMIAHHEGAIEMSKPLLERAADARVRQWAAEIITDQRREIDEMSRLLAATGIKDTEAAEAMRDEMQDMMHKTMSENPDINFVMMMVPHHAGAIDMSLPVLMFTNNPKVRKIAEDIIVAQAREIAEFRHWLDVQSRVHAL